MKFSTATLTLLQQHVSDGVPFYNRKTCLWAQNGPELHDDTRALREESVHKAVGRRPIRKLFLARGIAGHSEFVLHEWEEIHSLPIRHVVLIVLLFSQK